jgi:prophage maintenance system killer protein
MGNPAKTILLLILLLLIVIIFFALTGLDLSKPEQSANKMVVQLARLNRAINRAIREFFFSVRMWFRETFSR